MARRLALTIAILIGLSAVWCGQAGPTPRVRHVDLLASLPRAEKRPLGSEFSAGVVTLGGETHTALEVPSASRVIWSERLPDHAALETAVGVSPALSAAGRGNAVFRIGIADERSYDELLIAAVPLDAPPRWQRVSIDLSKYGGFKWSLFYRPRWKIWKVTFNTTLEGLGRRAGAADRLYWARPMVDEKG